jgi:hypothetical protein
MDLSRDEKDLIYAKAARFVDAYQRATINIARDPVQRYEDSYFHELEDLLTSVRKYTDPEEVTE